MIKDFYKALVPFAVRARMSRVVAAFRDEMVPEIHQQWMRDGGPLKLLDFDITTDDLVVDVGAYRGQWIADMFTRYQCRLVAVEPLSEFAGEIEAKYGVNPRISVEQLALGARGRTETMHVQGDASSVHLGGGAGRQVRFEDVSAWMLRQPVAVALMSINCEGGEYEIIPRLVETGDIVRVKKLLVQFHPISEESPQLRDEIRKDLARTHRQVFCYPFLWELWEAL